MKRILFCLLAMIVMLGLSVPAKAFPILELRGQGTSIHGTYNLIYDPDFDITWYDFSNAAISRDNQRAWAGALSVDFGGTIYDDWRLPETVDGPFVIGYDGTTTGGYNNTNSEMGHLFYTELGNLGKFDTSGNLRSGTQGVDWGLTNTGDFQNLLENDYWSGTEHVDNPARGWQFVFLTGNQRAVTKSINGYALAVRDGDVAAAEVVPEPATIALFGIGLAGLAGGAVRRRLKKVKQQ